MNVDARTLVMFHVTEFTNLQFECKLLLKIIFRILWSHLDSVKYPRVTVNLQYTTLPAHINQYTIVTTPK